MSLTIDLAPPVSDEPEPSPVTLSTLLADSVSLAPDAQSAASAAAGAAAPRNSSAIPSLQLAPYAVAPAHPPLRPPDLPPPVFSAETLRALEAAAAASPVAVPESLRHVFVDIAVLGIVCYPWHTLRPLLVTELERRMAEYQARDPDANYENNHATVLRALEMLPHAPFTMQRLCELAVRPETQYQRTRKLLFALEKLVLVAQAQPVLSPEEYNAAAAQLIAAMDATRRGQPLDSATDMLSDSAPSLGSPFLMPLSDDAASMLGSVAPTADLSDTSALPSSAPSAPLSSSTPVTSTTTSPFFPASDAVAENSTPTDMEQ